MALVAELDVKHHQVVGHAVDGVFRVVAVEPLVDPDVGPRRPDPGGQLSAGGLIVLDQGHAKGRGGAGHGAPL
ncbi:hypothetical protein FQZ97_1151200 [compost metagenome]